jgi:hypothetical protein
MVSTSGSLLLSFRISAYYEIKVLLTLFQIFHKKDPNLKVRLFIFGKGYINLVNNCFCLLSRVILKLG